MKEHRVKARNLLNDAPLQSFWEIVRAAKISDEDQKVLDLKFIHGLSNVQIAIELAMSLEKVNAIIKKSYDKIARLL